MVNNGSSQWVTLFNGGHDSRPKIWRLTGWFNWRRNLAVLKFTPPPPPHQIFGCWIVSVLSFSSRIHRFRTTLLRVDQPWGDRFAEPYSMVTNPFIDIWHAQSSLQSAGKREESCWQVLIYIGKKHHRGRRLLIRSCWWKIIPNVMRVWLRAAATSKPTILVKKSPWLVCVCVSVSVWNH